MAASLGSGARTNRKADEHREGNAQTEVGVASPSRGVTVGPARRVQYIELGRLFEDSIHFCVLRREQAALGTGAGSRPLVRLEAVEGHQQVAHPADRRQAFGEAREIV